MNSQAQWAQALLNPEQSTLQELTTWNSSEPSHRLAVYQNNVMTSLVGALSQTYPVITQLVGQAFFQAMAQVFVRQHPPRTRVLAHYGGEFPSFIAQFPPAAGLPYLADVALLEWNRLQALHAADVPAMDLNRLRHLLEDEQSLRHMQWQLHPSLHILQSSHAAVSLWASHQPESGIAIENVALDQAESALIFRSGHHVMVLQIQISQALVVTQLQARVPLQQAMAKAFEIDQDFDPAQTMALLIRHELLTDAQQLN